MEQMELTVTMYFKHAAQLLVAAVVAALAMASVVPLRPAANVAAAGTQSSSGSFPPQVKFTGDGDHQNMMDQLGIKALRPGADPNNQTTFDEASANKYPLPDLMIMKNGKRVTTAR